jgi:hypothetical protein
MLFLSIYIDTLIDWFCQLLESMTDYYLFDLLVDYLVFICKCFTIITFMYVFSSFVFYYYRLLLLFRCLTSTSLRPFLG